MCIKLRNLSLNEYAYVHVTSNNYQHVSMLCDNVFVTTCL